MKLVFRENLTFLKNSRGVTQADIGLQVGKGGNTIGYWEKGKGEPSVSDIHTLSQYFDISIFDLLYTDLAKGNLTENPENSKKSNLKGNLKGNLTPEIASDEKSVLRMPQVVTVDTSGEENVILVPVRARAGYLHGYEDPQFISKLPAYSLPGFRNGSYRMFEVDGVSMYPTLNDHDVVIGQFVENLHQLRDDRIYVVVTKTDGVVVKRVLNRIEKENKLILKSDNYKHKEDYPPLIVDPEEVIEIWYVAAFMSRQMKAPQEIFVRVSDTEARITFLEDQFKKLAEKLN